jgi:hypothetical protein
MRSLRWVIFALIVASLGGGLGASQHDRGDDLDGPLGAPRKHPPGNPHGEYVVKITGGFTGSGTATVGATVSLHVKVTNKTGGTGTLIANNLVLDRGYFRGNGMIMGTKCTIQGRTDLSSGTDGEETDRQATTGRITGTFLTEDGKVGRLVAVQGTVGS